MRIILWIAGFVALAAPCRIWADPGLGDTLSADGRQIAKTTAGLVMTPLHASTGDWLAAGAVAGGVALTSVFDTDVRREVRSWDDGSLGTVDDVGHVFQNAGLFFATAGAFYVGGYAADKPAIRRIGPELVVGFAVAQAGTQLVKHLAGRARPYLNEGSGKFVGPTFKDDHLSFWSGDVTTAFVLASVLSAEAKHPAVTILMYGLATTTAFQRIHTDHHWLSDVAAAAVWSTAVGINTVKIANRRVENGKQNLRSLSVTPMGLTVQW